MAIGHHSTTTTSAMLPLTGGGVRGGRSWQFRSRPRPAQGLWIETVCRWSGAALAQVRFC